MQARTHTASEGTRVRKSRLHTTPRNATQRNANEFYFMAYALGRYSQGISMGKAELED